MTVQTRGAELLGRTLGGRYRLLALVGTGASAGVYLAEDTSLRRRVAVKVLHPGLADDVAFQKRFRAEARSAASLSHPHVLAVHDWSEDDGDYLVTELLEGGSLRDLLATGARLSLSQALLVGLHAGQGLAYAHRQGFVHRDVKPANLLFDRDGRLRIGDFGIARAVAEAAWTEPEGVLVGTARYAAPEQASSGPIDGRADVYSLALTVIEAVTGEVPLVGETPLATMARRQSTSIPVPDELGPLAVPLAQAGTCDRDRRLTADGLVTALLAAATKLERPAPLPLPGLPIVAADVPAAERTESSRAPAVDDDTTFVRLDRRVPEPAPDADSGAPEPGHATGTVPGDVAAVPPAGAAGASGTTAMAPTAGPAPSRPAPAGPRAAAAGGPEERAGDQPEAVDERPGGGSPPRRTRRRRRPWAVLVLLLVAGAAAGTWLYLSTRTPSYEVGTYVGAPIAEVRSEAAANEWVLVEAVERRDGTEAGEVLEQVPPPGTSLEEGGSLSVLVSQGQLLRTVPALGGLPLEEAEAALAEAELALGTVTRQFDEQVPADHVLSAGGTEGAELETGTAVDLVVSDGPAPRTVPNVAGSTPADAVAALESLGLVAAVEEQHSQQVPEGSIISITPGPGEQVARGSTVQIVVSLGRPFITVPNVVGLSAAEASDRLEAAGFVVIDTIGPPNRPVLVTDPPAGESRRQGQSITIVTRAS